MNWIQIEYLINSMSGKGKTKQFNSEIKKKK